MSPEDKSVLERLAKSDAQIICMGSGKSYAAYKRGDRRTRPLFYLEAEQALRLHRLGFLTAIGKNQLGLSEQDQTQAYCPPVRPQQKLAPLQTLSKSRSGRAPYLTAKEVRAGQRYAVDFARAHQDGTTGQRYDASGVFTQKSSGGQEAAMAARVDAGAQIKAAQNFIGAPLASILAAVLGQNMSLEDYENRMGWADKSARPVFKKALADLAECYETMI